MREEVAWVLSFFITIAIMVIGGGIYLAIRKALSKRPHKSDDEEDNPIVKFKDDLADIYEDNPNGKLKKLAQAVWNRVVEIEKWHNDEIHDWERKYYSAKWDVGELDVKCNGYREELDEWTQRCEELQSKLNESQESLKRESAKVKTLESETDKLRDMLKEKEQPDFLIEKRFPGQTDPFIKITMDEEALKQSIPMNTGAIIHIDSEDLNRYSVGPDGKLLNGEPLINNEELVEKLRNFWGLEAQKAVELPNTVKKKWPDDWVDAIESARDPDKWPEYMAKVEGIPKNFNKYKVTLYDNKENETIETELYGANIYDALKSIDNERYSAVGYRCVWRNKGWC